MLKTARTAAGLALALLLSTGAARAETVRVFVGGAMTGPVRAVAADYTRRTGDMVEVVSDTTGGLQKRLRAGEKADVVLVTSPAVDTLQKENLTLAAGRADLARALIGVGVKAGAASPDLSSVETFKAALVAARSVSYVDPAAGGTSGGYFEGLLKTMGIADVMKPKTVYRGQGSDVAQAVASGAAEIGITFTSELAPNPGVKVAGTLPAAIQMPTIYTVALTSGTNSANKGLAFLRAMQSPVGMGAIRNAGLEPLGK